MVQTRSQRRGGQAQAASPAGGDGEAARGGGGGAEEVTAGDVLMYYPNLVGYLRVAFSMCAFYFALSSCVSCVACYILSFAGDLVDGKVARMFDQTSKFGGVLDMVTDRCTTAGLLTVLAVLYQERAVWFILLMVIDLSSHWVHVISTANEGHHKAAATLRDRHLLLRLYYGVYPFFGYLCVGTEFFYVFLYVLAFFPDAALGNLSLAALTWLVCFPACLLKQFVNVAQLNSACYAIAEVDAQERNAKAR